MRRATLLLALLAGCRDYDSLDGLDQAGQESRDLAGADLTGADLAGADLAGTDNIPDLFCASSALAFDGGYDAAGATAESIGAEARLKLHGDATAGLATIPLGSVQAADVTGDGLVDLIALAPSTSMGPDELTVSVGALVGAHTEFVPTTLTRQVGLGTTMTLGDLDGDKIAEIVLATDALFEPTSSITLYRYNASQGKLSALGELPAPARPRAMVIGDLDLDGAPDLVVGFNQFDGVSAGPRPRGYLRIYWGKKTGLPSANDFTEVSDLPSDISYVAVAELEGGCLPSLVVGHRSGPAGDNFAVVRHEGLRGMSRDEGLDTMVANDILGLSVADLDRDGLDDVVVASYDASGGVATLRALYSRGHVTPRFDEVEISSTPGGPAALADLDRDGLPDVFFVDQSGTVSVAIGSPGRQFAVSPVSAMDQAIPASQPVLVRSGTIVDFYYPDAFTPDVVFRLGAP